MDRLDPYEELRDAVRRYLEDAHRADVTGADRPWPLELEELTGWTPPDGGDY